MVEGTSTVVWDDDPDLDREGEQDEPVHSWSDLVGPGLAVAALVAATASLMILYPAGDIGQYLNAYMTNFSFTRQVVPPCVGAGVAVLAIAMAVAVLRHRELDRPRWSLQLAVAAVLVGVLSVGLNLAAVGVGLSRTDPSGIQTLTGG